MGCKRALRLFVQGYLASVQANVVLGRYSKRRRDWTQCRLVLLGATPGQWVFDCSTACKIIGGITVNTPRMLVTHFSDISVMAFQLLQNPIHAFSANLHILCDQVPRLPGNTSLKHVNKFPDLYTATYERLAASSVSPALIRRFCPPEREPVVLGRGAFAQTKWAV